MDLVKHARGASVPLESVLCTEELQRRPSRPPDYQAENRALVALTQALADAPRTILQTLADTILDVLQADSAGVSLLTPHDGGKTFYWPAIAGAWKPHIGGGTPRDFGPCGDVLDRNIPLLFRHFERRYTYFQPVTPPTEECLLVPFYVAGTAVGTIWAITHNDQHRFDAEDQRQLVSLGRFASAAYQAQASVHATAHLAAIIESSDDAIVSKDLNGIIQTWNRGAERLFGYPASEAIGQSITLIIPADRLDEEPAVLARIRRGERIDHYETVRRRKDGTCVDISLSVSPITDMRRQIVGASKIARDITERTQATAELERRRLETATLTEIAQRLTTSLDLDTVLQQVVLGAQALCGSARVFLALRDPGTEVLVGRYEVGASQAGYSGRRLAPGEGLGGQVLRTGRPWRTADYGADGRFRPVRGAENKTCKISDMSHKILIIIDL
jgi:PAS domain S-box-containing protein